MKIAITVYCIVAFLYFCNMYRNTYVEIRWLKRTGKKIVVNSFYIIVTGILRSCFFPIDFLFFLLREL